MRRDTGRKCYGVDIFLGGGGSEGARDGSGAHKNIINNKMLDEVWTLCVLNSFSSIND